MTLSPRILIGTLIAFLIVCAGLGTGFYLYAHKAAPGEEQQKSASPKKTKPNFNTYDVSPPSRATTLDTKEVVINPVGNTAFTLLSKAEAENIKTGQKILLYTAENVLLETLGEVSAVTVGTDQLDGFVTVHMTLQSDDKVDATEARHGRIILKRIPNSARLPLSALVKNDKNEPYVWTAVSNTDGTINAYLKRAELIATTYDYFVIQPQGTDSGLYILNPDKDLEDGQTINTRRMLYAAPPEKDDFHIESMMADRRRERMARMSAEAAATKGPATSSEATTQPDGNNSCAAPPNAAKDFMDKVTKLSPATPTQGSISTPSPNSLVPPSPPAAP